FSFIGGTNGQWQVTRMETVIGTPLEHVSAIDIVSDDAQPSQADAIWILRGTTSYERYVNKNEQQALTAVQPTLNRPHATCAALIPIKKSAIWWALPQDERRSILEEQSHHVQTGMAYLPAVARRLHHGYDLGEPFDFLTWFEYAPEDADAFEELTSKLRATEEWHYVEREIDIRLIRQ
ncbi:MAG: chlorite dismutase family protein, partial [Chitinophagaceae bacterium]|nr:chlorite dismutase family protein [Anaerolineae bacterium]